MTIRECQAAVDWLLGEHFAGAGTIGAAAVETKLTGAAELVPPEYMPILEAVLGGKFAAKMARVWNGDYSDSNDDESAGDWALTKEITRHARWCGLDGAALALAVETLMRAGPYRRKWDSPRKVTLPDGTIIRTTWLGRTIGRAIEYTKPTGPTLEGPGFSPNEAADTATATATAETPEQIIARLERELAEERRGRANDRAAHAALQTVLRATRAELEAMKEGRARDRRFALAERELRRTKLTGSQVDAAINIIRIGTQRANYFDTDAPIITGKQLAEESAVHESTARANAEAVCTLPGSPITRATKPLGMKKKITTYELASRDPVAMIEQMVVVARAIDAPKSARPTPVRCPVHPDAGTKTTCDVAGCTTVFAHHPARPPAGTGPQCVENARIGDSTTSVVVPVPTHVQHARIGEPDSDELADRRARAAQAIPMGRDPDTWKTIAPGEPAPNGHGESLGRIAVTRANGTNGHAQDHPPPDPPPWRCYSCGWEERVRRERFGDWVCAGCTVIVDGPAPRIPTGTRQDGAVVPSAEPFVPSPEWQRVPDGYPCPPGGEFRLDFATGFNWGRWPEQRGEAAAR